jgi:hypothetical protein
VLRGGPGARDIGERARFLSFRCFGCSHVLEDQLLQ